MCLRDLQVPEGCLELLVTSKLKVKRTVFLTHASWTGQCEMAQELNECITSLKLLLPAFSVDGSRTQSLPFPPS